MTVIGSNALAGASGQGGGGYEIERSLRFTSGDSAYLNRTPSSAGNLNKYTWSGWVKKTTIGTGTYYLLSAVDGSNADILGFEADSLMWYNAWSGGVTSTDKFRDPSAWYHIVFSVDSTQSTEADRVKMYVNGRQLTSLSGTLYPSLNRNFAINGTVAHKIGQYFTTNSSDFYLADINFIDGQGLAASDFAEYDNNNVWQPKKYSGSYGTNGFYLDFNDDGQVYSDEITGSDYNSSYSKEKMFDSSLTTGYLAGDSSSVTWTPTGGLAFSSTLKVKAYASPSTNIVFNWDGGSYTLAVTTNQYYDVSSNVTSPITSVTWTTQASGGGPYVYAVEVDGKVLVNHNSIETDSSGNGNHWTANNLISGASTKPKWYTSTTYYTTKADVVANATDRGQAGFTLSSAEYIYLVPNDGGNPGAKCHPAGSTYPSLHYVYGIKAGDSNWVNMGGYGATEPALFQWDNSTNDDSYDYSNAEDLYLIGDTRVNNLPDASSPMTGSFPALVNTVIEPDVLRDSPTNGDPTNDTGAGGEVSGNYCTFNSLKEKTGGYTMAYADGNLELSGGGDGVGTTPFTSGKKYFELTIKSASAFAQGYYGIVDINQGAPRNWATSQIAAFRDVGSLYGDSSTGSAPAATQVGDVYGFAVDVDNNKLFISVNGTYLNSANPANGTGASFTGRDFSNYAPLASLASANSQVVVLNAGQRPFNTAAPSGFKALCTANLPEPTIADGSTAFDTKLWTGNGSTQALTMDNSSLSPDFVWIKNRSTNSTNHAIFDTIRGATNIIRSDTTDAENSSSSTLTAFNSNGFTVADNAKTNASGSTYVAWAWDAGSSNTSIAAGGLTNTLYDSSQTWSTYGTFDDHYGNSYVWSNVFNDHLLYDGTGSLFVNTTTADKWSLTSSISVQSKIKFFTYGPTTVVVNSGLSDETTATSSGSTYHYHEFDFSGNMSSFSVVPATGTSYIYFMGIWIDGKQLVDSATTTPTIASTVRANPSAGFSICEFTSANGTVGHGLSAAPHFIIAKRTDAAYAWATFWHDLGNQKAIELDKSNAAYTYTDIWGSAMPTSSVFSFNTANVPSGGNVISYCFAPVEGYSAFGSYTGNGSADGPFIYTGMNPRWIMTKRVEDSGYGWQIHDTARDSTNINTEALFANGPDSEATFSSAVFDLLSNGFKPRGGDSYTNASGKTYIYAAFAEHPFKTARAR